MPLDPSIIALLPTSPNGVTRTAFVVDLATPTPRKWTTVPGGITVGGVAYTYVEDLDITAPEKALQMSNEATCTIVIANLTSVATDLVTNAANKRAVVTIRRIWFSEAWVQSEPELFFQGLISRPYFVGGGVAIDCKRYSGRKGKSPNTPWVSVMTSHTPPDPNSRIPWFSLEYYEVD